MRITDDIGIPTKGIASFEYKNHIVVFDTLSGPLNPNIMIQSQDGKVTKVTCIEEAIGIIDGLVTSPE